MGGKNIITIILVLAITIMLIPSVLGQEGYIDDERIDDERSPYKHLARAEGMHFPTLYTGVIDSA